MTYRIVKLAQLVREITLRNVDSEDLPIYGVTAQKVLVPTRSKGTAYTQESYKVVERNDFVVNFLGAPQKPHLPISMNFGRKKMVTSAYKVFRCNNEVIPMFIWIFLSSDEVFRRLKFQTDGAVREDINWKNFIDLDVPLPPIEKQREYVAIYSNLLKLSSNHEKSFADLQLVADIFMESLLKEHDTETLGNYIKEAGRRNKDDSVTTQIGLENKDFVAPKVRVADDKRDTYKVIQYNEFACNLMHVGRDMRLPVGLYAENTPAIISPAYKIFKISQPDKLLPEYLLLYFKRPETDRLMAYMTDSSVRQGLEWDRLCEAKLPVPPLAVQKSIVAIYHALESRKALNERLKNTIKDISPVLIKDAKDRCK